jgi:hypothetical protein
MNERWECSQEREPGDDESKSGLQVVKKPMSPTALPISRRDLQN